MFSACMLVQQGMVGTGKNGEPSPVDRVCCHSPLDDGNTHLMSYLKPDFWMKALGVYKLAINSRLEESGGQYCGGQAAYKSAGLGP